VAREGAEQLRGPAGRKHPQVERERIPILGMNPERRDAEGRRERYWLAPIVADAEAGFGGPLNAHELMKSMI
jgi:isocitrate lyase